MTKEEFIGKLQMCYFGDRNAFNEIVGEYDRLKNKLSELENINEKIGLALDSAENKVYRLNNVIDNLKSFIEEERCDKQYAFDEFYLPILNKLKELKDSEKNDS